MSVLLWLGALLLAGWMGFRLASRRRPGTESGFPEAALRRILAEDVIGSAIAAPSGEIIEANDYYLRLIGYSREELERGLVNWRAITPPEWLPADENALAELRLGGRCAPYEKEYLRRDGTRVPVLLVDAMMPEAEGGIAAFALDLSTLRRVEAERDALARQLRLTLDAAQLGWWSYDPMTRISTWDDRYREIFEVTEHQRPNDEILKKIHPDDLPRVWAAVEAALDPSDSRPYSTQYRIVLDEGRIRWIEAHGIAEFEGAGPARRAVGFVGTVEDITARKEVEQALLYREQLLTEMGSLARVGGWEFDPATGKGTWTAEVARIHDLSPDDETSLERGLSFYSGESRARIEQAIRDAVERGVEYDVELEMTTARGNRKWVQSIGHPRFENGRVVRVSGSFQDITERKKVEAALTEKLEELRRWYAATLGRESRVLGLKREVNALLAASGKPPRYSSVGRGQEESGSRPGGNGE